MRPIILSLLLLLPLLSFPEKSKFLTLCLKGDKNADLIRSRVAYEDGAATCEEANKSLREDLYFDLSCPDYDAKQTCEPSQQITNLDSLSEFNKISSLELNGNSISDISPLFASKSLFVLELRGNTFKKFSQLNKFTNLAMLKLGKNSHFDDKALKSIEPIIIKLYGLDISETQVHDLSFVKKSETLQHLNINFTKIGNYSPLYEKTNWYWLGLSGSSQEVFNSLPELKELAGIEITHSNLTQLDGLNRFPGLVYLNVGNNKLKTLNEIDGAILKELSSIYVDHNQINDIRFIYKLKFIPGDMFHLDVSGNKIENFLPLTAIPSDLKEKDISIQHNPVSYDTCLKQIKQLVDAKKICKQLK